MTEDRLVRLLTDFVHVFQNVDRRLTQMEMNMAVVFDGLSGALADLNTSVGNVSAAVAALPQAGANPASVDEAAIQAQLDTYMAQVKALTDQLNADVAAITAKSVPAPV